MSAAAASAASAPSEDEFRLPRWQKPSLYDVALVPDLKTFAFQGQVHITLALGQATNCVVLNAADLTFPAGADGKPRASIRSKGEGNNSPVACQAITLDSKAERATFDFGSSLAAGEYVLSINYMGTLNDQLAGFYRSSYKGAEGTTQYMVRGRQSKRVCWGVGCWSALIHQFVVVYPLLALV
jgi:aminopeptidase N